MHWSGRRMLVVGAAGLAATLVVLALLHSAPVRSRALAYAVGVLRDQYGATLRASDLRYSLLKLRFELSDVRMAATTHLDAPFLQAGALVVDLRWSTLIGELSFDEIELRDPILTFQRPAGRAWNLPLERRPQGEGAIGAVYIDRLVISNLQLAVDDRIGQLSTDARALSLNLGDGEDGTVRGTLRIAEGLSIRIGEKQTQIAEASGAVAFDGRGLSINDLRLSAPEGTLSVNGTLRLLDEPQRVDAQIAGSLDLSRLSPWLSLRPAAQGIVRVEGRLEGPLFAPSTTLALSSADVSWWPRAHGRLDAAATIAATGVTVESARLELNGGTLSGSAKIPFSDMEVATTLLEWHAVDIESLLPADTSARLPRLDGRANGAARLSWQSRNQATIELTAENTVRPAARRRGAIGVGGRTTLDIREGSWRARHDHLVAAVHVRGEMNGTLSDMTLAEWPLRGSLRAVADNLGSVAGELAAAGLLRRGTWVRALNGAGTVEATLEGTLGDPRLTGAVRASVRPVDPPATVINLEAIADVRAGQASVRDLRLLAGPNSVHGSLHVAFPGQELEGALRAEVRDIATLPLPGLVELRAFGSGTVSAQLGGTVQRPQVDADVSAHQLSVFEQPIDAVSAQLRLDGSKVFARSIELTQGQGHATVAGVYDLQSHAFEMRADAQGAAWRATDGVPLSAILDSLTFSASGTLDSPQGRGRIELSRFDVFGVAVAPLSMDLTLSDGAVLAAIRAPELSLTADGRVTIASPRRFQLDGRLDGTSLAKVQEAAHGLMASEPRLDGLLTGRLKASCAFDDLAAAAFNFDLISLEAQTAGVPIRLEAPIVVDYARNGLTLGRVQLRIGRSLMTAEGTLPQGRQSGTVRVTVKGDLSDIAPFLQLLPNRPTVDLRGAADLALDISGSLERLSADGALAVSGAEVRWRDLPPVHADLSAAYTNGALELRSLRADWQGARVSLAGRIPTRLAESWLPASIVAGLPVGSPPGHLDGRIEELTARALDRFVAEERLALLGGRVDATIRADIARPELSGISGEIVLDKAELMLAQVPLSQTTPTRLQFNGDRLTVERSSWSGGTSEFNLNGAVTLGTATSVDARIVGTIDLRTLGAFVGEISTAGRAGLDLGMSGPISSPEFEGAIAVSEGTVRLANPRVIVTEINGSLDVARDRVTLREMRGTANGGDVALSGGFEYSGLTPTGGSVTATAREVAFEYPAGFRSESDAELTLSFSEGQPTLGGRITVLRGRYRESLNLAGLLVEASALTPATADSSESDVASRVRLDVALTTANDVLVDNNYGRLELEANLRALGALANPVMTGRITLREGSRIFLGGRTYQVESGAIDFNNTLEPDVEIVATTRVADYVVTLVASGRPGTFTTELTAEGDESLSERDILALLLTGRVSEGGTEGLIADVDSQQVLGLLSSEVTGLFDRFFGLRGVRFEQGTGSLDSRFGLLSGDTDPSARLTIEQTIGSRLRVIVSQNLREADPPTWLTIYRPTGRLDARFISRDDESRSMEVGQELSFGAAKRDQVPTQTRKPPMEFRVSDVRFEGSPGFTRDELLGHLSQRPGTTFDFVRWQEDRDRLERVYRDRGFLEARIGARRAEAPQEPMTAVVLEYQVERGPRTTLLVSGATLPGAVYRDLEDLWSGAVFDELVADDLASRVRAYLAETGHLQPTVEAHLDLDLARATKTVRIRIDPGTRSEKREVQFEGSAAISPDRLQAFLQQRGLERTIWLDRDRVERELEDLYRRTGYLAADVAIPPPTLEGRIARLAVRIAEGSPFAVGMVKLAGVERRDPSLVQRELALEPGTAFRPDLIDDGVRRLEQGYRDNGYREVQIDTTTVVDRSAGAVDVTVSVREGPQHVIQEVTITGGEAADQQTIDRALQLSSGRPVNAAVLSEARRRLYRLGRFARVDVQGAPVGEAKDGVQPVRAAVILQEAPRYVFRYALQGTSALDDSAEGRDLTASALAELRRRNLFGRAASAGGVLLYRPNRRIGRASLTVPALLTESMESSAYLSRSQERFGSGFLGRFIADKTELTLEQLYRSGSRGTLVFNYRYERNHTFAEADPGFFDLTVSVARLSGSFVLDRRDDPLNARRGLLHSSTIEYAGSAFGSDLNFAKWLMQQFLYRPAGPVVFASAARVGAGYPLGGDLTLIPSERFLTGGSTSVRGYVTDSLGPQSGLGDPTGGQGFLLLNQEARFPLYGWVGGVGFIDAGNVFERAQDISFRGLKVGVGVGLRINTPVALLRFDVARPWSPGPGESGYRWHFSIGQLF